MLKNKLKDTLKNKKGFTLAELLIVVAIIAILVAISIPVFAGKLDSARQSTDQANERAAKAVAITKYLEEQKDFTMYYNADDGKLEDVGTSIKVYGKSSKYPEGDGVTKAQGNIIKVVVTGGDVSITWIAPSQATKVQ